MCAPRPGARVRARGAFVNLLASARRSLATVALRIAAWGANRLGSSVECEVSLESREAASVL